MSIKLNTSMTRKVLPYLLMGLSLFCLFLLYSTQHPVFQYYFYKSDILYLPTLFQDILEHHGHFKNWFLTPAPYFFPDYLLFFSAYLSVHTAPMQMIMYAIFQMILLTFLLSFFFKNTTNQHNSQNCTVFTSILLLWLAFNATFPFTILLMSAFHAGGVLIQIASLTLFLRFLNSTALKQRIHLILILCVLSFITTCSDTLFFIQLIIPAFLAYVITQLLFQKKITRQDAFILLPVISSMIGFLSYTVFVSHPTRYSNQLGFSHFKDNLHQLLDIMRQMFTHSPIINLFIFIFYLFSFLTCCYFILNKKSRTHRKTIIFLMLLIQISAWGCISSMLFITNFPPTDRYLIPTVCWPIIVGVLFLSYVFKRYFHQLALLCTIGLVISLYIQAHTLFKKNGLNADYYPSDVACIDQALNQYPSLNHGIAQYWDAKFIQNYSQHPLILAQYDHNLIEHIWITSTLFYRLTYDFAIISNHAEKAFTLSRKKLKQLNGEPLNTIHCGEHDLLIFNQDKLKVRAITSVGDSTHWLGCELPTIIGQYTSNCETTAKQIKKAGFLTYGPYEQLPAGRYQFEIKYTSSKRLHSVAGSWDVISTEPHQQTQTLATGLLYGTKNHLQTATGQFTLTTTTLLKKIEIRTQAYPGKFMSINQLILKRI